MLDSQFRGTTQQFVLHFNEQFRRLDGLPDISERMAESIKMALLQNAVKDITHLSIVETLDEYTSTTCRDGSFTHLNYSSYYNLLLRGEMFMQLLVIRISTLLKNPTKHISFRILTPHEITFCQVHQTKHIRTPPPPPHTFICLPER